MKISKYGKKLNSINYNNVIVADNYQHITLFYM